VAATKAMTGPVLMTSSGVPDFIRELFFVPIQGGYAHLMQRTKEERPLHRDQGGGLSGGEPAQFEEFRGQRQTHGVLQFPPGQADAVRQGLGIGDREGVHRERRMSGIR